MNIYAAGLHNEIEIGGIYQLGLSGDRVMVLRKSIEVIRETEGKLTFLDCCEVRRSIDFEKMWVYSFELEKVE